MSAGLFGRGEPPDPTAIDPIDVALYCPCGASCTTARAIYVMAESGRWPRCDECAGETFRPVPPAAAR